MPAKIDILVVEDNPGDQTLFQEALKFSKCKLRVHFVIDGKEAIDFLLPDKNGGYQTLPRLILLDLNLPTKTGREVLKEIKAHPILRSIPTLLFTTSDSEKDVSDCYALHANAFVVKPNDFEEYVAVIKSITDFWFSIVQLPARIPYST